MAGSSFPKRFGSPLGALVAEVVNPNESLYGSSAALSLRGTHPSQDGTEADSCQAFLRGWD